MDEFTRQLAWHPWPALAGAMALAGAILQVSRRRPLRQEVLPGVMATALFPFAVGIANAQLVAIQCFRGLALIGSGAGGAVAAGLGEARYAVLVGSVATLVVLAVGAVGSLTGRVRPGAGGTTPGATPGARWPLLAVAILAAASCIVAVADHWVALSCQVVLHREQSPFLPIQESPSQLAAGLLATIILALLLAGASALLAVVAQVLVVPLRPQAHRLVGALLLVMIAAVASSAILAGKEQRWLLDYARSGVRPPAISSFAGSETCLDIDLQLVASGRIEKVGRPLPPVVDRA
ncbi:MAG TPA: hypothetical protein VHG32_25805 [Thermoanaerobaculia bacterium]|jgi:hypothetical protein|nr:hypothetical protein [Thermoanaerobaculia bacterium]